MNNKFEELNKTVSIEVGDFIIDLDVLIADTIILLNKKGYKTTNCCQGHPTGDDFCNSYISFREKYNIPIPKGYKHESYPFLLRRYFLCKNNSANLQQKLICKNAKILEEWAKNLPNNI
ncbi:hypothetical protein [Clostridium botulinum]|uniref:hypothetical protein n=2 Tax=Clostridium botulinum TaxID=1491 RepID=UPI0007738CDE|nr:hypothetical protein [Clostridium botulinum]AUN01430.1 hypothetical protein RSJ19_00165 [Clostridium botulinum]